MPRTPHRDIGPFASKLRNFFLGRTWKTHLRHAEEQSPHPYPPADEPPGPATKLSHNYYYIRDARRRMGRPQLLVAGGQKLLPPQEASAGASSVTAKGPQLPPTPGTQYTARLQNESYNTKFYKKYTPIFIDPKRH